MQVRIFDTTLRDGMQREGVSLSVSEKIRIAHLLDSLGVAYIEAGFPASNPKDVELFERLADEDLTAAVTAFTMTRRRGLAPEADPSLTVVAESWVPTACIVGKTWDLHLEKVVRVSRDENLELIGDSVAFLVAAGKEVVYDAEHFFDAYRSDRGYAIACVLAAAEAGAANVTLCDTNGATLPDEVAPAVAEVRRALDPGVELGIHTHDDAGCGVANAIAAVRAGARLVQGTLNGYGERCGNANLVSIIPSLQLKLGYEVVAEEALQRLTGIAHEAAEICNLQPDPHAPYVGRSAFAHKGGLHVAGVEKDPRTFEHIDPERVGNARGIVVSELSGRHTIIDKAAALGLELDAAATGRALDRLKELEHRGYAYEAADASFELLLRQEAGELEPLFVLESLRVIVEKRADGETATEAVLKLWIGTDRHVATGEGNGPVHALDAALRSALGEHYPEIRPLELSNYKVRILDSHAGTGAVTRVILDMQDGHEEWSTVGVSPNIIEASWEALVESLLYGLRVRSASLAT